MYAWDTPIPDGSEPKLWFHDIFRKDGTPYKQEEVDLIKKMTGMSDTPTGWWQPPRRGVPSLFHRFNKFDKIFNFLVAELSFIGLH